jgi:hypothetical protein
MKAEIVHVDARLSAHAGATPITREALATLSTPPRTRSHYPFSHADLITFIETRLWDGYGIEIDVKNKGPAHTRNPYNNKSTGGIGVWLAGGGSYLYAGAPANPSNCAIAIGSGGNALSGQITALGSIVSGGALYTNGSYTNVPLINGTGSGAIANITVAGGLVTVCTLVFGGYGYHITDLLSAAASTIGGTGSGFSVAVSAVTGVGAWETGLVFDDQAFNSGGAAAIQMAYAHRLDWWCQNDASNRAAQITSTTTSGANKTKILNFADANVFLGLSTNQALFNFGLPVAGVNGMSFVSTVSGTGQVSINAAPGTGADANIDLYLNSSGALSYVAFGTYNAGAPVAAGYITVRDAATGRVTKLLAA